MNNGKSKNSTGAGATNPVKTVSYRLSSHFLYCPEELDKNQTTYPTAIQTQNLTIKCNTPNQSQYYKYKYKFGLVQRGLQIVQGH